VGGMGDEMNRRASSGRRRAVMLRRGAARSGSAAATAIAVFAVAASVCQTASAAACANEGLRSSLGSSLLGDCRAYEMVTPPYKDGYPLVFRSYAADGEKAILASYGAFADPVGTSEVVEANAYTATRTGGGWRLSPMNAPLSEFVGEIPAAYEADDGMSLWKQHTPRQSSKTAELYVRSAGGEYTRVGTLSPNVVSNEESDVMQGTSPFYDGVVGATSNYQHVLVSAKDSEARWPFDQTISGKSLYEYSGLNNARPVLVATSGGKVKEGEEEELLGLCGEELGGGESGSTFNALSSDGETVFFTLNPCGSAPSTAEVYARLHGAMTSSAPAETVDVSARECSEPECGVESGKNFEGASENGEKVFFTSTQKLTAGASNLTAGGSATEQGCAEVTGGCDLYEYDFALAPSQRLTLVDGGVDDVRGVVGIAQDGSRVYYVAGGDVAGASENELHHRPVAGESNLYVFDTDTRATAFVATLGENDAQDWARLYFRPAEIAGEGGRFLLFASSAPGITPDESNEAGLEQLYEYDAQTGELVRVTQGERVAGAHGEEGWNENGNGVATGINPEQLAERSEHLVDFKSSTNVSNIAADGKTVAFETTGELSPRAGSSAASSGRAGCTSVYEFHSEGAIKAGMLRLLSDGRDIQSYKETCGAQYAGMDESGSNVLFETDDSLLTSDVDGGQRDIYDARADGGFAPGPVDGEPAACTDGRCLGSGQGNAATSGTPSVAEGNLAPAQTVGVRAVSKQARQTSSGRSKHGVKACRQKAKKRRKVCKVRTGGARVLGDKGERPRRGA
jgi:hypothetical protein